MRLSIALAALCLIAPVRALAQDDPPPPAPIEAWSFEKMELMGRAIWRQDQAAIAASNVLHRQFRNEDPPGLAGWIVVDEGEDQRVRFITDDGSGPRVGWDVVVRDRRAGPLVQPTDATLSPAELAQYHARMTAARNVPSTRCGKLNSVVLRDPENEDWLVWLLANADDSRTSTFDGNFRFRISTDGQNLLRRDQLFTGCHGSARRSRGPAFMSLEAGVPPSEVMVYLSIVLGYEITVEDTPTTFAVFCRGEILQALPPRRNRPRCR